MLTSRPMGTSLDRMFTLNRAFDQALSASNGSRVWVPAFDVAERRDAYVVQAELPGVSPDQVEITFEQNILTVRGTKSASFEATSADEVRVFVSERVSGGFERSVRLPEYLDLDHIDATFANGLLTVTVPKAQAAQARKISIKTPIEERKVSA